MPRIKRISNKKYIAFAKSRYDEEGVIEVDEDALISRGFDKGAYVQAWIWVSDSDVKA